MAAAAETAPDFRELEAFDRVNSPRGLLLRYAHGRVRTIGFRSVVTLCGVALTWVFSNLMLTIIIFTVMATFEVAEFVVLKRLLKRRPQNVDMAWATPVVTFATTLQAMGIGASITAIAIQGDTARLAAWVFLIGVTLNSLLVARYHPASHRARISVYFLTVIVILVHQTMLLNAPLTLISTEIVSFILLAYMLSNLFQNLSRREFKMLASERERIKQSQQIQSSNTALQSSQTKLAAREKEASRLALVAEHATDSVILTDASSNILWVNSQFTRIMGYSLAEAVGHSVASLLDGPHTNATTSGKLIAARQQSIPFQGTIQNHRKDGSTVWMEVSQTPVFDDHGQLLMYISVERDATATMEKQAQLRKALAAANLADKEKTDFLARMSHELRTPTNGVVGSVDLMSETDLSPAQADILNILEQASSRMQVVVDDILSFCELSAGNLPIRNEKLDLVALIQDITKVKRSEAKGKGLIGPIVHVPPNTSFGVLSDQILLQRIFSALIGNAIKFTEKGRVDVFLRLTHKQGKALIEVEVRDTGVGIAAQDHSKIFNKFTQADGRRTRKFDGAGLGLSIAKSSAHQLGGDISLCKKRQNGSSFTVSLCLTQAEIATTPRTPNTLNNPNLTLLVAEDNHINRMLIRKMLKDAALHLEFAEDGIQAVEKYAELRPDIMLMDVSMPHKDGLQATREIRLYEVSETLPTCPILALTANTFEQDRKKCFEAGMTAFLPKPVCKQKLINALEAALQTGD